MRTYWLPIAFSLFVTGCATHSVTPIKTDPNWVSEQLDNGLRYHIYPDTEKEVSVRLIIHSGSFQETQDQKGYAHFVEHMAFNGSEHFSQNDVISLFENAGLSFGADINAYTSYEETVYKLDLPNNSELNNALTWMRDIGDGIELSSKEVEKEKDVILGEFRYSRFEEKDTSTQFYEHMTNNSYDAYDPLGNKESVVSASSETLSEFYKKWYQPQLAEIVITGDVTLAQATELVKKHFTSWEKGTTAATTMEKEVLNTSDFIGYIAGGEAPSINMIIDRGNANVQSREKQHQLWLDYISQELIEQRMNAAFLDAAMPAQWIYSTEYFVSDRRYSISSVSFPTRYREQSETQFLEVLASLRDYGATANELEDIVKYYQYELDNMGKNRDDLNAVDHAENKSMNIVNQQPSQSILDYKESLEAFISMVDLTAINQHMHDLLSSSYQFGISLDASESIDATKLAIPELRSLYNKQGNKPLLNNITSAFPVPAMSGSLLSETLISSERNLTSWTLDNGINVLYLRDVNSGNDISISLASKGGMAALTPNLLPAANIAIPVVSRSGLGDLTGSQLDAHLRRNDIELYPYINFTHHGLEVLTNREGIAESFAVLSALMSEIKVDGEQLKAVKQEFNQNRTAYLETPLGKFTQAINHNTYVVTSSHRLLEGDGVVDVTDEQIKQVHQLLFQQNRNYQLVIVADLKPTELKPLLRQYVASIQFVNSEPVDYAAGYKEPFKPSFTMAVNTENNSHYIAHFIANKADENQLAKSLFMEDMLQRIVSKRLMSYVREELSLDYAPYTEIINSDGELRSNWIVGAQVAPKNAELIESAIDKVITDLLKGVSEEETRSAAKQLVVDLSPMKNNSSQQAWLFTRYTIHGYGIDALLNIQKTADSINSQEMTALIQSTFGEGVRKSTYLATPTIR
ncbi:pitrilysin family protein [Aliivibrio sp. SR45-2]|uniref:M16 family metallopeptidase n=1 Tax=Aliivibrio sp. SR45-2 TaxID=2760931 RepID=UPI0015F8FFEB|nr:M16 family metallopeptidase [Aliivibrio sp. SR45-2]MBB1313264.1 insulinase family protein [Aliivibrio sp. SR45-2]